jgi:hypothetical protein
MVAPQNGIWDMPVKILAWIHIAIAGTILFAISAFFIDLFVTWDAASKTDLEWVGPLFAIFGLPLLIPQLLGGVGLLRNAGWARIIIIVLSGIYLLMFPAGTILGAFGLWALLSRENRAQPDTIAGPGNAL